MKTTSRAPPLPQVERTEIDSTSSLIDVDGPHVAAVPPSFPSQPVKTETQAERLELEERAKEEKAERKAKEAKEKAKEKARIGKEKAKENAGDLVRVGNAVTVGILGTVLGVGAYRKWVRDELSWKVVGGWAAVVGVFAVGDYYVSK